jgi:hypothetical protein
MDEIKNFSVERIERSEIPEVNSYMAIKPMTDITISEANQFWDDFFSRDIQDDVKSVNSLEGNHETEKERNDENQNHAECQESDISEAKLPIQNKIDGLEREKEVYEELQEKYPPEDGFEIISEAYLRDADGNIARDKETGEARRIDFIVVKNGKVVDSVEVTSKTADKTAQSAKEVRIRESGGNYIRDNNGNLVEISENVSTRIERKD